MCHNKPETEEINIGRLLGNIGRAHSTQADRHMEKVGLFRSQALVLFILSDQDGLTHSELAEKLEISPAATTKVIKRLEGLNFLQRQPDPSDERVSRVFIRDEGRGVIQQIHKAFESIDQNLVKNFSLEEQKMLYGFLSRMYENLQSMNENG